ncbi:uncharacterized protein [Lepeophtheirus salmonis]|uniref:uncharacterized protein isoform X2 n=1 Tax=Lepeophtheirus salmonis TaxID=72036 RepID=UPI003AF3A9C4
MDSEDFSDATVIPGSTPPPLGTIWCSSDPFLVQKIWKTPAHLLQRPKYFSEEDSIFEELKRNNSIDGSLTELELRGKRGALDLSEMVKCATGCNPLIYQGYGCYCGFLGSGGIVDGIDRCCKMHDWCYTKTSCMNLKYHLPYFVGYKWRCNGGSPYCVTKNSRDSRSSCSHHLCECDREFAICLQKYDCPNSKAMCHSSWRHFQNLFMGIAKGHGIVNHNHPHQRMRHLNVLDGIRFNEVF